MDEGAFRILRALTDGSRLDAKELVRRSGEASSVLRALQQAHPEWFESERQGAAVVVRATPRGLSAFAREWGERNRASVHREDDAALLEALANWGARRSGPKAELDQVWATPQTVLSRAKLLMESGDVQRGLCILGDDDLTSLAVGQLGVERSLTAIDVDEELLALVEAVARENQFPIKVERHDLRQPIGKTLRGRFGCVFTDPPYAMEGFTLFVSRAIDLLRPDGRLYVSFGASRRAPERGLQKQRALAEMGLLVESVWEQFSRYDGAESIGSASDLWRLRKIPATQGAVHGVVEGDLYTHRSPKKSKNPAA